MIYYKMLIEIAGQKKKVTVKNRKWNKKTKIVHKIKPENNCSQVNLFIIWLLSQQCE